MDMESVQIFLDVWRTGSLTAAAEKHFMTQPALGKRIAGLEKEMGISLFHRGKGQPKAELTPEGKAFCDIAERMVLLNEQAMELKVDARKEFLTIASIRSAHDTVVPEMVLKLKEQYQNMTVVIEEHQTAEIIELLEKKRVDIGIIQSDAVSQKLKCRLLYREHYRVIVRPGHPLAEKNSIIPEDLQGQYGIFQVFDDAYEKWFTEHWHPWSVKVRTNTTPTSIRYFSEPEDWMIVPEAVACPMEEQGFISIPIIGNVPLHKVYMCWNSENQRGVLQYFLDTIVGGCDL